MILQKDIIKIAQSQGVPKTTVDKDWVLGHFIDTIFSIDELKSVLIFKGGTALRKCWFENYRFSEDLDFTSTNHDFVLTRKRLELICERLTNSIQLPTHIESLREQRHNNQVMGFEAIIKFWGADHPANENPPPAERWLTKIKIEITINEKVVFEPVLKSISHPYPDTLTYNAPIPCYCLEEVITEKLRALIQRSYTAPRDYYDLWYILSKDIELAKAHIKAAFIEKLNFKGHDFTGIEQLINPENNRVVGKAWQNSLVHQIKKNELPSFEEVSMYLEKEIKTLLQK